MEYSTKLAVVVGDDTVMECELTVEFEYTPGLPALTPRGEYAPIDPPEPPEANITEMVLRSPGGVVYPVPDWLDGAIVESVELHDRLIEHAQSQ